MASFDVGCVQMACTLTPSQDSTTAPSVDWKNATNALKSEHVRMYINDMIIYKTGSIEQ